MMTASDLTARYDQAAPAWGDKMRLLGYYDGYLGFLAAHGSGASDKMRVLDIGCGSGTFADAWAARNGPTHSITLLDPSSGMLARADAALRHRGLVPTLQQSLLDDYRPGTPHDYVLAAHVLEHVDDPIATLRTMRTVCKEGGLLWLVVSKPHWCNAIVWLQWRHKSYRRERVRQFLDASGWDLEAEYAFPSGPPSRTSAGYLARAI